MDNWNAGIICDNKLTDPVLEGSNKIATSVTVYHNVPHPHQRALDTLDSILVVRVCAVHRV